jgi:P-type Cu+ transporter
LEEIKTVHLIITGMTC